MTEPADTVRTQNRGLSCASDPCDCVSGQALASQDDVFFCPVMDLAAMRTGQPGLLEFGCFPQGFFNSLTGRRQLARGRAPDQDPFNDRTLRFFQRSGEHKFIHPSR